MHYMANSKYAATKLLLLHAYRLHIIIYGTLQCATHPGECLTRSKRVMKVHGRIRNCCYATASNKAAEEIKPKMLRIQARPSSGESAAELDAAGERQRERGLPVGCFSIQLTAWRQLSHPYLPHFLSPSSPRGPGQAAERLQSDGEGPQV